MINKKQISLILSSVLLINSIVSIPVNTYGFQTATSSNAYYNGSINVSTPSNAEKQEIVEEEIIKDNDNIKEETEEKKEIIIATDSNATDSNADKVICDECLMFNSHSKDCSQYVPECECDYLDEIHDESCPLYEPPLMFSTRPVPLNESENVSFVETSKNVIYDEATGSYKLSIESWLNGSPTIVEHYRIPSDIIFILDQSGSMDYCFGCGRDDMKNIITFYSGATAKTYYCLNEDKTATIPVYYCDLSNTECTHKYAGWYDVNHSTNPNEGTLYSPSIGDSDVKAGTYASYMRKFYKESSMKTVATSSYFVVKGEYYRKSGGNYIKQYYCSTCCCWYDDADHSTHAYTDAEGNKSTGTKEAHIPDSKSGDNSLYANVFYYYERHPIAAGEISQMKKTDTYYIRTYNCTKGDNYSAVTYCSQCDGWHLTTDTTHNKTYTPTKNTLYTECTNITISRYDALQNALKKFLENVYKDSAGEDGELNTEDDVNNRIGMVGFAASDTSTNILLSYASSPGVQETVTYKTLNADTTGNYYKNALQSVNLQEGQDVINTAVTKLKKTGNTETFKGLDMAKKIIEHNPIPVGEQRGRVVIVFTDGEPSSSLKDKYGQTSTWSHCDEALDYGYELKNDYGTIIYSIGVFLGADNSNMLTTCEKTGTNKNKFMHLLSSNYMDAVVLRDAYDETDVNPKLTEDKTYYLSAVTTDELNSIFENISNELSQAGGTNITTLNDASSVKDYMDPRFEIKGEISAYTEAFTGVVDGEKTWEKEDDEIDDSIVINEYDDHVEVTGFSFIDNYIATDIVGEDEIPRGRKLVVEFEIKQKEENLGGIKMATNIGYSSGVYNDSNILMKNFQTPHTDIPTNIKLEKSLHGLQAEVDKQFEFNITYEKFIEFEDIGETNIIGENNGNYLKAVGENTSNQYFISKSSGKQVIEDVIVGTTLTIKEDGDNYRLKSVIVTDANDEVIEDAIVSENNGIFTIKVFPGMTITFTNKTPFSNTLFIEQTIKAEDAAVLQDEPIFMFKVYGTDENDEYHEIMETLKFTKSDLKNKVDSNGNVTLSIELELPIGFAYTIEQIRSNQYALKNINVKKGTVITNKNIAVADLSVEMETIVEYVNYHDYSSGLMSAKIIVNKLPGNKNITGI